MLSKVPGVLAYSVRYYTRGRFVVANQVELSCMQINEKVEVIEQISTAVRGVA